MFIFRFLVYQKNNVGRKNSIGQPLPNLIVKHLSLQKACFVRHDCISWMSSKSSPTKLGLEFGSICFFPSDSTFCLFVWLVFVRFNFTLRHCYVCVCVYARGFESIKTLVHCGVSQVHWFLTLFFKQKLWITQLQRMNSSKRFIFKWSPISFLFIFLSLPKRIRNSKSFVNLHDVI